MKNRVKPTEKPLLRGHSHQAAFFVAIGACSMLLLNAHGERTLISALVYSLGIIALFGISALYHRPTWKPAQRMFMRKLDHATIYIMIAGTATPVCLLALPESIGIRLLQIVWLSAALGLIHSLFWTTAPKWLSSILYVAMGCFIVPYVPELRASLSSIDITFILLGGVVYIMGAIIYALRRPDPRPAIFGYHEIFHLLVIAGAIFHFLVINKLIRNQI